jgi:hypothetical protein
MANDAYTQQALALDPRFKTRVKAAVSKVAWVVLDELTSVTNHTIRANYARFVLANLDGWVSSNTPWLVMRTNVFSFTTSYDFPGGGVVTASGDADLESQLTADWNKLAGL